jgi:hypothetical protein
MDLFLIFTGTCSKGWKNNSFALCQLQSVQRWFWRRWNECTFSSKWTGEIRGLYPWFVFIYSLGIQGTHKYNYSSFFAWTRIKCFHSLRWGVYELCISQFQRCPSPPPRATPWELAISGKKMAMSPPQGKKNCAKAPPLGKQIGSISPPPGNNINCLVHVDLHVIIQ